MRKTCKECYYWREYVNDAYPDIKNVGTCHCLPPMAETQVRFSIAASWPRTYSTDYCGEWLNEGKEVQDTAEGCVRKTRLS